MALPSQTPRHNKRTFTTAKVIKKSTASIGDILLTLFAVSLLGLLVAAWVHAYLAVPPESNKDFLSDRTTWKVE